MYFIHRKARLEALYSRQKVFYILLSGKLRPYVEYDEYEPEAILRIFPHKEDAIIYTNQINELGHKFKYTTHSTDLNNLWRYSKVINDSCLNSVNLPVRVEVCYVDNSGVVTIDTILNFNELDN